MAISESGRSRKRRAYELILLFGTVSLLGDLIYESGRSILGPYLQTLGASAVVVGVIAGIGEFVGYGLRFAFGYLAQRTRYYWGFTLWGYALIAAIPLAGWASAWETVAVLFVLERLGKALRTPARDTILSYATAPVGRGWGFALHEAVDQIGAVIGPLLFAWLLSHNADYAGVLRWTAIPLALLLLFLWIARRHSPQPQRYEDSEEQEGKQPYPAFFWWYLAFAFWSAVGFVQYPLIAYHAEQHQLLSPAWIAGLYAVAMGADSLAALLFGKWYDRFSIRILWGVPLLTAALAAVAFRWSFVPLLIAAVLWGMTMALHETVLRAFVADAIAPHRRAFAYGIFNTIYGVGWLIGGTMIGWMYKQQPSMVPLSVGMLQLLALGCWMQLWRALRRTSRLQGKA